MIGISKSGSRIMSALSVLAAVWVALPAKAQVSESERLAAEAEQRCVWSCLANYGPASNPAYHDCVERMCLAPTPQPQSRGGQQSRGPAAPATGWTNAATPNGAAHSAVINAGGKSLHYICQRGGKGLIAIDGLGGPANGVGLRVDNQRFALPFVMQNGILYTAADPGLALMRALMAGNTVEITGSRGQKAGFPLRGSSAAIRKAMAGCGIRP